MEVENPKVLPFKQREPQAVAECGECGSSLLEDELFLYWDGLYFCDDDCLMDHLEVEVIEGWELK